MREYNDLCHLVRLAKQDLEMGEAGSFPGYQRFRKRMQAIRVAADIARKACLAQEEVDRKARGIKPVVSEEARKVRWWEGRPG